MTFFLKCSWQKNRVKIKCLGSVKMFYLKRLLQDTNLARQQKSRSSILPPPVESAFRRSQGSPTNPLPFSRDQSRKQLLLAALKNTEEDKEAQLPHFYPSWMAFPHRKKKKERHQRLFSVEKMFSLYSPLAQRRVVALHGAITL